MADGLITLEEGPKRYLKAGGSPDAFKAFAIEHKHEIFHADPITGEEWPWPEEFSIESLKAAPERALMAEGPATMKAYKTFDRSLLKSIHAEVKASFPRIDLRSTLGVTQSGNTWFVEGSVLGQRRADRRRYVSSLLPQYFHP